MPASLYVLTFDVFVYETLYCFWCFFDEHLHRTHDKIIPSLSIAGNLALAKMVEEKNCCMLQLKQLMEKSGGARCVGSA